MAVSQGRRQIFLVLARSIRDRRSGRKIFGMSWRCRRNTQSGSGSTISRCGAVPLAPIALNTDSIQLFAVMVPTLVPMCARPGPGQWAHCEFRAGECKLFRQSLGLRDRHWNQVTVPEGPASRSRYRSLLRHGSCQPPVRVSRRDRRSASPGRAP